MAKNPRLIDMSGRRIGQWQVLTQAGNAPRGGALWRCLCDCGNERSVNGSDLRTGKSVSCGHSKIEKTAKLNRRHGLAGTRLYRCWQNMRKRCQDPKYERYKNYGGRGITVCDAWGSFIAFRDWALGSGYQDNLTIERIDVDGNYEPANCTWADATTQARNRRFVRKAPDGRAWSTIAAENGISIGVYHNRMSAGGWTPEDAATWPLGKLREARVRVEGGRFGPKEVHSWRRKPPTYPTT